jgi:membrane-bound lytic murein transglycosylase MltF
MKALSLAILITILFSISSQARVLKIAYYYGPPQSITDKNGNAAGIVNTRARAVLNKLKIKHKFELQPIKRIYDELAKGSLDIFNCGLSPKVKGVLRGKKNIAVVDIGLFSKKGVRQFTSMEDVKGQKIATIRGASMGGATKYLKKNNEVTELTDPVQMFNFVEKGRAHYVLVIEKPGKLFLNKLGYKNYNYNSMIKAYCRWMVSKKLPNAEALLKKLDSNTISAK